MKFQLSKFKPTQIKSLECLNCGQPLLKDENFCSYCGQKNITKKLSLSTFITNLFSGFFSYDSRFWTTFIPLLTKPGKVSKEYIEGKRVRFVNPFQLYLNISIIFFLIFGISTKISKTEKTNSNNTDIHLLDSVVNITISDDENYVYHIKSDSINAIGYFDKLDDFRNYVKEYPNYTYQQGLDSLGYKKTFWNTFNYQQIIKISNNVTQFKTDGGKNYYKTLLSFIPISLFIFLPVFTLFLWLLYIRGKYSYMEHLVFVFNTQSVFFLLYLIFHLLNFVVAIESYKWIFTLTFMVYLYIALRNFYQQNHLKTTLKYLLLNSFYLFLAIIGIGLVAAISFVAN